MCIICDMQQLNEMHANASLALVKTLAETTLELVTVLGEFRSFYSASSERGKAIDVKASAVIDKANRVVQGMTGLKAPGASPEQSAGIVDALQRAFPGAQIIAGTPEDIEAAIEQIAKKKNDKTPH